MKAETLHNKLIIKLKSENTFNLFEFNSKINTSYIRILYSFKNKCFCFSFSVHISAEYHERLSKIDKLKNRYEILTIVMLPPEEEEKTQAYYVIKVILIYSCDRMKYFFVSSLLTTIFSFCHEIKNFIAS